MKSPPFSYIRAESLEQAFDLIDQYGEEARILAGGQSLMATLNMRLSTPKILIDINKIVFQSEKTSILYMYKKVKNKEITINKRMTLPK